MSEDCNFYDRDCDPYDRIDDLEEENKKLKAELKVYEEGIKPEEAKEGEMYFYNDIYDQPWAVVKYQHGFMATHLITGENAPMYPQGRLHPLPPINNKGGE